MPIWRKITPGTHTCRVRNAAGKVEKVLLRKGDKIEAEDYELGLSFLDEVFECLTPEQEPEEEELAPVCALKVVHKGHGRYCVINEETGEAINQGWLTRDQAYHLVDERDGILD